MNVNETENKGLKRSYECTVPADEISRAIDAELKSLGQNVKIAGFRPGFVPVKILQQRYGKSVQAEVIRNLVTDGVTKVVNDNKIRAALAPTIQDQKYQEGGPLTFRFS